MASAALMALLVTLCGCQGDDGDNGANGAPGAPGSTPIRTNLDAAEDLPGIAIEIVSVTGSTGAGGSFAAGDTVRVNFTVKTTPRTAQPPRRIPLDELDWLAILFSGPSFNYQRVLPQQLDVIERSVEQADGSWTYTFASAIPATYAAPLNNPSGPYDTTSGVLTGQTLLQGTYTVGMEAYKNYTVGPKSFRDAGNATFDVRFGGASTTDRREVVKIDNCNQCHTSLRAHGGIRRSTDTCVLCHTAGALDRASPGADIEFKVMVHRMHDASHLPSVNGIGVDASGNRVYNATRTAVEYVGYQDHISDFTGLLFPVWPSFSINMPRNLGYSKLTSAQRSQDDAVRKGVVECAKCHGGTTQGDLAYVQPSRRSCGACHDDINWSTKYVHNRPPDGMPAQLNDATCNQCHAAGGGPAFDAMAVRDAHKHPVVDPRFATGTNFRTTAVSGGTGPGGAFKTGDPIRMTFTLKDNAGNDLPIGALDSANVIVTGPTRNYQQVLPLFSPTGFTGTFEGITARLAAPSTANKGTMSKLYPSSSGTLVTEVVTVLLTSSTAFNVIGTSSGAIGSGTLGASASTNPSGSSIANVSLGASCAAGNYTVAFTSATNFVVTGPGAAALGSGDLPATRSASTRFVASDGSISFNIAVGTTAATAGDTFNVTVFRATNATSFVFAIVVGRTAFSTNDRFYYDAYAPAASYTMAVPMDITTEFLGRGDGTTGQTLTAAMAPVAFGRQTLLERTATGAAAALVGDSSAYGRFVDVAGSFATTGAFGGNGFGVLDDGKGLGTEEYLTIQFVEPAPTAGNTRVWFRLPIRFNHRVSSGATLKGVTLTTRLEGVHYTLDAANGVVAATGTFGSNAIVMTYRTAARFGVKRFRSDSFQGVYQPPFEDSPDLDESNADWGGKAFESGTYTLGLWGYRNIDLGGPGEFHNEVQTYRMTSPANDVDFLFGSATEIDPYKLLSYDAGRQVFNEPPGSTCLSCHNEIYFHGGSRRGFGTCILCHGTSGAELSPRYDATRVTPPSAGYGVSVQFRSMLHKFHAGEELTNVLEHGPAEEEEVVFPSTVNGVIACQKCHGTTSDAWFEPSNRTHSTPLKGNLGWVATCGACHTSESVRAHMAINTATFTPVGQTTPQTLEACAACHGPGADFSVELMHKIR